MNESKSKLTEQELKLIEETELFMEEVYSDPEVANAEPPSDLHDKVFAEIRAREAAKQERILAEAKRKEEEELIRLGRIYKRRQKLYKYVVLAAVLIMVMAFGITSVGGPEKMFEMVKYALTGHEQINVDSRHGDVIRVTTMNEEAAYQKIEEIFDFTPVELLYLPEDIIFLDAKIGEEIQGVHMSYGINKEVKIAYFIRPNYREGSYGKDIEDEFIEEHVEENEYTTIYSRKYLVEGNEERWSIQFEYQGALYSMTIMDTSQSEVEKIVENLYFS